MVMSLSLPLPCDLQTHFALGATGSRGFSLHPIPSQHCTASFSSEMLTKSSLHAILKPQSFGIVHFRHSGGTPL